MGSYDPQKFAGLKGLPVATRNKNIPHDESGISATGCDVFKNTLLILNIKLYDGHKGRKLGF